MNRDIMLTKLSGKREDERDSNGKDLDIFGNNNDNRRPVADTLNVSGSIC